MLIKFKSRDNCNQKAHRKNLCTQKENQNILNLNNTFRNELKNNGLKDFQLSAGKKLLSDFLYCIVSDFVLAEALDFEPDDSDFLKFGLKS